MNSCKVYTTWRMVQRLSILCGRKPLKDRLLLTAEPGNNAHARDQSFCLYRKVVLSLRLKYTRRDQKVYPLSGVLLFYTFLFVVHISSSAGEMMIAKYIPEIDFHKWFPAAVYAKTPILET